jgi:CBS domain-containing protein
VITQLIADDEDVQIGSLVKNRIISMPSNLPVTEAAKLMKDNQVGSVIIKDEEILGIITKGDIIQRVVGKALDPGIILAGDVMSKPVSYVTSDETLPATMLQMSTQKIERILVVDANDPTKPIGIISTNDLLKFAPGLLSIRSEQALINAHQNSELTPSYLQGFCDDCGNYSDKLSTANGYTWCPQCITEHPEEFQSDDDEIM